MTAQKKKLFFFPLAALPLLAGCAQQDAAVVGTGVATADFASGRTVEVALALTSP